MRRRQVFAQQNNRAPVPSGAGMGAAAASVPPAPSPVSRQEEEAKAAIWRPYPPTNADLAKMPDGTELETCLNMATDEITYRVATPQTDPLSNARRKPGWPKGKKRGPRK
jgi:hypothetical protein